MNNKLQSITINLQFIWLIKFHFKLLTSEGVMEL